MIHRKSEIEHRKSEIDLAIGSPEVEAGVEGEDKQTSRQGDRETGRQGDRETRRQGDRETGRQGDKETRRRASRVFRSYIVNRGSDIEY